jgi:hypothetical protein
MFVALIQEHLAADRKFNLWGSIKHPELVPQVKLRVNVRMQIELDLPSVRYPATASLLMTNHKRSVSSLQP